MLCWIIWDQFKYFDEHFYANAVQQTNEYEMISQTNATDVRPLDIMLGFNTDKVYLNPGTRLFSFSRMQIARLQIVLIAFDVVIIH